MSAVLAETAGERTRLWPSLKHATNEELTEFCWKIFPHRVALKGYGHAAMDEWLAEHVGPCAVDDELMPSRWTAGRWVSVRRDHRNHCLFMDESAAIEFKMRWG